MEDFFDDIIVDNQEEEVMVIEGQEETEQTDELQWLTERLGMITGSTFSKLIVSDKKGGYTLSKSQTADSLILKIAYERLLKEGNIAEGLERLDVNSREVNYGKKFEPEALQKYQLKAGVKVHSSNQIIKHSEFIGGTPDGLIGDDGLIEIKCPYNGANHLKGILTGEVYNSDYIIQMQFYMWITGREWCDFVTYDKDLSSEKQLNIIRIDRDNKMIEAIKQVAEEVNDKIINLLK